MFLQRHPEARKEYKSDGCYLFLCFKTGEIYNNMNYSMASLNEDFQQLISIGAIDDECFVNDADKAHAFYGVITEIRQDFEHDQYPHHAPPGYICKPGEFEYLRYYLDGSHFVYGDGRGNPTFDPWGSWNRKDPYSKTVTYGKLLDKRIFRLLEVI